MPLRGLGTAERWAPGFPITTLCAYTLATYSAAGTYTPTEGDLVTYTTTNDRVVLLPDNSVGIIGRVVGNPNTVDLTVTVEWLDIHGFCELDTDDVTTITIGNAVIKDGNTTVVNNVDGLATTGNLKAVSLSASSGAGKVKCAICIL